MDIHTENAMGKRKGKKKTRNEMQNGDDGEAQNLRKEVCNVSMDGMSIRVQQRFAGTERDRATTERDVKEKENERK